MKSIVHCLLLSVVLLVSPHTQAAQTFNITINYTGDAAYQLDFITAKNIWESIIPSYRDGTPSALYPNSFSGITISANTALLDETILGSARPSSFGMDGSGFILAYEGEMTFNTFHLADLSSNARTSLILHEMGHAIGLGSLWGINGLYTNGTGRYTGQNGLLGYQNEFNQPNATFVPVEQGGGAGTSDGHWDEVDDGSLTGRVSLISGRDMTYELMTGWLDDAQDYYISNATRGSLIDLGYNAILLPVPVPEPQIITLLLLGMAPLCFRKRRVA
jgi:hypothetical protein